jgi:hypothetical protein
MMKKHKFTFFIFLVVGLTVGCSGLINRSYIHFTTEENLLKAGFKKIPVNEEQEVDLAGFPAGKISSLQRHGTIYYIYPDLKHNSLLMGDQNDLARYHNLVTQQLIPFTSSSSHLEHDWTESGVWKN